MVDGLGSAVEVGISKTNVDQEPEDDRFYQALVPFDCFDDVMRRDWYRPLPDGWVIAVIDVSHSTESHRTRTVPRGEHGRRSRSCRRQQCTTRSTISVHVRR
ncbi:DUF3095 family protein [Bradyrhizobium sp. 1050_B9_N1_2]|uniref:DUF3095 family protein n=1 Tax=Bradyrhizobium sp. 1050_B9_N1_2 TaxID=3238688 RepID=UPI003EDC7D7F